MRHDNWERALSCYLTECSNTAFAWGEHDCCLFAANTVLAMTGTDFAAPFRGKYSTALGSVRALKRYGSGDLHSTLIDVLGSPVPNLLAKRGDVALVEIDGQLSAGIHYNSVWCVGDAGLVSVLPTRVISSWSI
jgi:hypothetical protein